MKTSHRDGSNPSANILAVTILVLLGLSITSLPARNIVWKSYPNETKTNMITAELKAEGEVPELMAIVVQRDPSTDDSEDAFEQAIKTYHAQIRTNRNAKPPFSQKTAAANEAFKQANWIAFQTNVLIDLGPGDGERTVYFSYRYKGQTKTEGWSGGGVTVRTSPLQITFVNPEQMTTPYRILQLQGKSTHELRTIRYEHRDESGMTVSSGEGIPNSNYTGGTKLGNLSKCFTCYDIELSRGTNTIALSFEDVLGNTTSTNLVIVFSTEGDTQAPLLLLEWPTPGTRLAGPHFTARGKGDDSGAILTGWIIANGNTNAINGFPERNGYFWYEDIPIALGKNLLTLFATDPAGNISRTNLVVYGVDGPVITMDDVVPAASLWDAYITGTGTVTPADNSVWINGVKAQVKPDGTWKALRVPVRSPNGGTAVFDLTTYSPEGMNQGKPKLKEFVATQASLGTNAMTLNASSPACGVFQLRLNGTAGRGFVLLSSTNLTDWQPILTNGNPQATFEYTDTNPDKIPCRFFRVVPLEK